jgi:hypothetical protein
MTHALTIFFFGILLTFQIIKADITDDTGCKYFKFEKKVIRNAKLI